MRRKTTMNDETTNTTTEAPKAKRGFAAMSKEKRCEIASKGGKIAHASGKAHKFTPDEARAAGSKGGVVISQNKEHMATIGRRGGNILAQDPGHMAKIGRLGGRAVSENRAHMAAIGKRGAESRIASLTTPTDGPIDV
jgi:uncharacterized protein